MYITDEVVNYDEEIVKDSVILIKGLRQQR